MTLIFLNLTALCMLAYLMAGMSVLDAAVHAMTTVATGGFSTHDASLGFFDSAAIDTIAITFMIVGSLPFLLYVQALQGQMKPIFRDGQVRTFFGLLAVLILAAFFIEVSSGVREGANALRFAAVNVTSILTGTGYATTAYDGWGSVAVALFFFIMFIGGCAGSTSCGIKIFAFRCSFRTCDNILRRCSIRMVFSHNVLTANRFPMVLSLR